MYVCGLGHHTKHIEKTWFNAHYVKYKIVALDMIVVNIASLVYSPIYIKFVGLLYKNMDSPC